MLLLKHRVPAVAVAACSFALTAAPAASAQGGHQGDHPKKWTRTLTTEVLAPFQLAVNHHQVYVADGGTSTVSRLVGGSLQTLASGPPQGEVAGLDVTANGKSFAYTATNYATGETTLTIKTRGVPDVVAHPSEFEQTHNPDGDRTYGLGPNASDCAKGVIEKLTHGPATYTGVVDSHPYAVASLGNGSWAVAEAAGNDILKVDSHGTISVLAILPAQVTTFTPTMVGALGAPDCLIGESYAFEPVPTDVEVGPSGQLWVSTLPGGPEDPSLGARGSVYKVNPSTGASQRVATGFLGATNLAVSPDGTAYVTELFAGKISRVSRTGQVSTAAWLPNPLSVEVDGGYLYAGTLAPMNPGTGELVGSGSVVQLRR